MKRIEVVLGKFLGLSSVVASSVIIGFGSAGVIISLATDWSEWKDYGIFMLLTILLGVLYISLSVCFSSLMKKRSTALGAGVLIFFWGMIIGSIWLGIYAATGGSLTELYTGSVDKFPSWFWHEIFLSPQDGNQAATMLAFGQKEIMGFTFEMPHWVNLKNIVLAQLIWTAVPLLLSIYFFRRRDI